MALSSGPSMIRKGRAVGLLQVGSLGCRVGKVAARSLQEITTTQRLLGRAATHPQWRLEPSADRQIGSRSLESSPQYQALTGMERAARGHANPSRAAVRRRRPYASIGAPARAIPTLDSASKTPPRNVNSSPRTPARYRPEHSPGRPSRGRMPHRSAHPIPGSRSRPASCTVVQKPESMTIKPMGSRRLQFGSRKLRIRIPLRSRIRRTRSAFDTARGSSP